MSKSVFVLLVNGNQGTISDLKTGDVISMIDSSGLSGLSERPAIFKSIEKSIEPGKPEYLVVQDARSQDQKIDMTPISAVRVLSAQRVFLHFCRRIKEIREAVERAS